jgi:hypothetical protein
LLALRFVCKTFTGEIVNRRRKTIKTLAPVVHTIIIMMSGLLLIGFGAGVGGSGRDLEARLLSPASREAKAIPVTTAEATFLTTTPAIIEKIYTVSYYLHLTLLISFPP